MENLPIPSPGEHSVSDLQEGRSRLHYRLPKDSATLQADFKTYMKILQRRKRMIIIPLLIVLPLVGLALFIQKSVYESTATLLIAPATPKVVNIEEIVEPDTSLEYYKAQYNIIKSRILIEQVVDTLQMQNTEDDPQSASGLYNLTAQAIESAIALLQPLKETILRKNNPVSLDPAEVKRREKIEQLQERTRVDPISTRLVNVVISGPDPHAITAQVNTLTEIYVAQNLATKLEASQQANEWLIKKVQDLKAELQHAEQALQDLIETRGLLPAGLDEKQLFVLREIEELNAAYASLQAQRMRLEGQLNTLKTLPSHSMGQLLFLATFLNDPRLEALRKQYLELELELAELSKSYGAKHPKMILTLDKMAKVQKSINAEVEEHNNIAHNEYKAVLANMELFEKVLANKKSEMIRTNKDNNEYSSMKRDIDTKKGLYESLLKRLNETEITKNLQTNNVRIVQQAVVPIKPLPKKVGLKILVSAVVVLCFSLGAVFIAEALDGRFKNLDDVEEDLRIPFLGLVPSHALTHRYGVITAEKPRSAIADGYRIVCTNIQILSMQQRVTSLLITSAVAGEGKTTTAANLGVSFAQLGLKVLLVDADLRRPTLHKMLNVSNIVGLSDILSGKTVHPSYQNTEMENLKLLPSGGIPHNPTELLRTQRIKRFCEDMKELFDIIIFDSAITLSIPDTTLLANAVDGVCLVHDPICRDKKMVIATKKILEGAGANIVGIIFNNINMKTKWYDDSWYYYNSCYMYGEETEEDRSIISKKSLALHSKAKRFRE